MQKVVLFLLALCVVSASCNKSIKPPLSYTVTNDPHDSAMEDIYIPDNGTYTMTVKVKFLTGYAGDIVKLKLSSVPGNVKVNVDSASGAPTYTHDFIFTDSNATQGVYPMTITAYTETVVPMTFNFNIHVIPANCATLFLGSLVGTDVCTSRTYTVSGTGATDSVINLLHIINFGNYGSGVDVPVTINCDNQTLTIPLGTYGNGLKLSGYGSFNADSMTITYNALTTPTGGSENCTVIYKH